MATHLGPNPLSVDQLSADISVDNFDFETTQDLPPPDTWLGQDRAVEAISMAAKTTYADFHAFVLGQPGSGRHRIVRAILADAAKENPQPSDWVYVNNFDKPHKPIAIEMPSKSANLLAGKMDILIDDLANEIPALFESEDYQVRRRAIEEHYASVHEEEIGAVFEQARDSGVAILRTPMGFTFAGQVDGEVMTQEQFDSLESDQRAKLESAIKVTQKKLSQVLQAVPKREKEHRREIETLNQSMATRGVDEAIQEVRKEFPEHKQVNAYLDVVRHDLIENAELFLKHEEGAEVGPFPVATTMHFEKPQFQRYRVNVMVANEGNGEDAPVVAEDLPTLANLIGRIEYASEMGTLITNFLMIKPGALHQANGGFLVLDARQVLVEPLAWDALKRCLRAGEISIYSPSERLSLTSTVSLNPDPIPLKTRVILIGERMHYYLLSALDPDFQQLFKIEADMDDHLARGDAALADYIRLVAELGRRNGTRVLDKAAVFKVIQESIRQAGDIDRLTLNISTLSDILREAEFWAESAKARLIGENEIEKAIAQRERRASRVRELSHESIHHGSVLIDTDGERVGQINALSVLQVGGYSFGRPSRLTARARPGAGKVVDIERESKLGGAIHSKGVLILQGYLATTFATSAPLSLWASLVFEQSYGGVDGDSASAAELIALLSALAQVPVRQSWAITGSVNQYGDIQAIGGVNEKIEGFFDICAERGLTGKQGVLIPAANIRNLCLRQRVVEAVKSGKFSIVPMKTISDGIEILTGLSAGEIGDDGNYPEGSLNRLVEDRLMSFARIWKSFAGKSNDDKS